LEIGTHRRIGGHRRIGISPGEGSGPAADVSPTALSLFLKAGATAGDSLNGGRL